MVSFIIIAALGILVLIVLLAPYAMKWYKKIIMLVERRSLNSIAPLREKVMKPLTSLPMISTIALRSEKQMIGVRSRPNSSKSLASSFQNQKRQSLLCREESTVMFEIHFLFRIC